MAIDRFTFRSPAYRIYEINRQIERRVYWQFFDTPGYLTIRDTAFLLGRSLLNETYHN